MQRVYLECDLTMGAGSSVVNLSLVPAPTPITIMGPTPSPVPIMVIITVTTGIRAAPRQRGLGDDLFPLFEGDAFGLQKIRRRYQYRLHILGMALPFPARSRAVTGHELLNCRRRRG